MSLKIESQVVSLDLAKRLKELGINQDSLFSYLNMETKYHAFFLYGSNEELDKDGDYISAFTASELGNILPNYILIPEQEPFGSYRIFITKFISLPIEEIKVSNNYIVNYVCDTTSIFDNDAWTNKNLTNGIYDSNLANSMAKMLIFLIENNLLRNGVHAKL